MPGRELIRLTPGGISRRAFVSVVGSAAGATLLALTEACGGEEATGSAPLPDAGTVRGTVVDAGEQAQAVGRIYLLEGTGLSNGRYEDVDSAGRFEFASVKVGNYQLQYWGANLAKVPEPLPNPVPIAVAANAVTVVRFQVEAADESDTRDRDINAGDFFFQEQPSGQPNATVVVKVGTLVCWYNVGTMLHTVTGGPWGDSGPLSHGDNFMWEATEVGTFPYHCAYHSSRMLATLRVEN
jgi:plastocyanin